jgi:hypothetical protein
MKRLIFKMLFGLKNFSSVEEEVEKLYADIWPKHTSYEKRTKLTLTIALLRARNL